jgi:hypothetical protein
MAQIRLLSCQQHRRRRCPRFLPQQPKKHCFSLDREAYSSYCGGGPLSAGMIAIGSSPGSVLVEKDAITTPAPAVTLPQTNEKALPIAPQVPVSQRALLVDSGLNLVETKGTTDPSGLFTKLGQWNSPLSISLPMILTSHFTVRPPCAAVSSAAFAAHFYLSVWGCGG